MISFEQIEQFIQSYKAYPNATKTNELFERFQSFQCRPRHFDTYSSKEQIQAFNYAIELIYVELGQEFEPITKAKVRSNNKRLFRLRQLFKNLTSL